MSIAETDLKSIRISEEKKRTLYPSYSGANLRNKIKMPHLTEDFSGVEIEGERTQQEDITRSGLLGCWLGDFKDNVKEGEWNFFLQHVIDAFNLAPAGNGMPGDGLVSRFKAAVAVLGLPQNMKYGTHQANAVRGLASCFGCSVNRLIPLIGYVEAFKSEAYAFDSNAARQILLEFEGELADALEYKPKTRFNTYIIGVECGKDLPRSLINPNFYNGPIGFSRFEAPGSKVPTKVFGNIFVGNTANISNTDPNALMKEGTLTWLDTVLFSLLFGGDYYKRVLSAADDKKDIPAPDTSYLIPSVLFRVQSNSLAMLPYKLSTYIDWNIDDGGNQQSRNEKVELYCRLVVFMEMYRKLHEKYADSDNPVRDVEVSYTYGLPNKNILSNPAVMNRYTQGQYRSKDIHDQGGSELTWLNMSPEATGSGASQFRFCLISPTPKSSWPDEHKEHFSSVKPRPILLEYPAAMPGPLRIDTTKPIVVRNEVTIITRDPSLIVDAHLVEGESVAGEYEYKQPSVFSEYVDTSTLLVPRDVFVPRLPASPCNCSLAMLLGNRSQTSGENALIMSRATFIKPEDRGDSSVRWKWV